MQPHRILVEFTMDEMDLDDPYVSADVLSDMLWETFGNTFEILESRSNDELSRYFTGTGRRGENV